MTLEERFDPVITDDALQTAIKTMNRERHLRRALAALMTAEDPPAYGARMDRGTRLDSPSSNPKHQTRATRGG